MWYELKIEPDDNGTWLITSPDFEEVTTFSSTKEAACKNGLDAIEEAIAARIARGDDIPVPLRETRAKGRFVEVPALVFPKSALYMILRGKDWTRADLMGALDCKREHVDRLFRLDHNSRLDSREEAFKAVGHPLKFDMEFPRKKAA